MKHQWQNWSGWQHFNSNTRQLLITSASVGITFEGIILVLYNLYVLRLGYGPQFIGVANSAGLITFAIVSLIVGLIGVGKRVRQFMIGGLIIIMLLIPAIVAIIRTDSRIIRQDSPQPPAKDQNRVGKDHTAVTPPRLFLTFVIIMTVVRIIQSAGMNTSFTYFNVYFDNQLNIDSRIIGLFTGSARLIGAGLVLSMPYFVRRWNAETVLVIISFIGATGLILLGYSPVWWLAGVGQLVALGMNSMRFTLFTSYVMEESPMRWHSLMAGLNETTGGLGFAAMALLGGYIITTRGYTTLFLVGAILLAIGTVLFWVYVRLNPAEPATVPVKIQSSFD